MWTDHDKPWAAVAGAVVEHLGGHADRGLSAVDVTSRLVEHGRNELEPEAPVPAWRKVAEQFRSPLVVLLLVAVVVSLVVWVVEGAAGVPVDAVAISAILVANAVLGLAQEARAERAVAALERLAAPTAAVVRDGTVARVPAVEVLPGDLLVLAEGDAVAADARLVEAVALTVNEAALGATPAPTPTGWDLRPWLRCAGGRTILVWKDDPTSPDGGRCRSPAVRC